MFENLLDPCIVREPPTTQQVALPSEYLIQAHLPKSIYQLCATQNLLLAHDDTEIRHEEQKAEGKAAVWIKLNNNPNQLSTVDFEIILAKMLERESVRYQI